MPPKGSHDINGRSNDDDDYVAQLLAQDAKKSSQKYSAVGMQAYMPKRPTTAAPKPNTRFLKNIIRSTDSHNAALKRKEEEEARERSKQQRTGNPRDLRSDREDHDGDRRTKRRRVEEKSGRREDRERESKRHARVEDEDSERRRTHRRRRGSDEKEAKTHSTSYGESRTRDGKERRRHKDEDNSYGRPSRRYDKDGEPSRHSQRPSSRRHRSPERSPERSRSPEPSKSRRRDRDDDDHHRSRRRHHRSPTSRSASRSRDRHHSKRQPEPLSNNTTRERDKEEEVPSSPDSDPLSNLIGPLPSTANGDAAPVRSRGRGAYKPSTMDSHFAENYDPTLDVQPDEDENGSGPSTKITRRPVSGLATQDDDWDMALEALRDRALWRRNGADRLREAGFGDDEVNKWTSNGAFAGLSSGDKEKGIDDVRWTKKGEGREWDRGKVVDEDGHIDVKAAW